MSVQTVVAIIGFGLSVGAFVPLLLLKDRRREVAVIALVSSISVLAAGYAYESHQHDKELRFVRGVVLAELARRDSTYEGIQHQLGDVTPAVLTEVLRQMVRAGEITPAVVQLHDQTGQSFDVRLYRVQRVGGLQ